MNLPALIRSSQQDVYMSLTILGCTVNCRFRFADCPLIHCEFYFPQISIFRILSLFHFYSTKIAVYINIPPSHCLQKCYQNHIFDLIFKSTKICRHVHSKPRLKTQLTFEENPSNFKTVMALCSFHYLYLGFLVLTVNF